jgi:hypothetical protein
MAKPAAGGSKILRVHCIKIKIFYLLPDRSWAIITITILPIGKKTIVW